jgi:N6-L-threonylcarbamoyladenine synthase
MKQTDSASREFCLLAIESSCDETSAAVIRGDRALSNLIATQAVHASYGGVVPELAGRAHQQNIVPVVDEAIKQAGVGLAELDAIAYTRGPGLLGSLLVGSSFAKSLSLSLGVPLIEVNHMQAHILAHFIRDTPDQAVPEFPFLCLTVSGGHTELVLVRGGMDMEVIGRTIDDAAGEAYDKAAKMMGLPYPGGPLVDKLAREGNPDRFSFTAPQVAHLDFSFSGLKTQFLYFLRKQEQENPDFIKDNLPDLCASLQKTITAALLSKLEKAALATGLKDLALAGGVSANSALRAGFISMCEKMDLRPFVPPMRYCTDNAAMIGMAAMFKLKEGIFSDLDAVPLPRMRHREPEN